MKRFAVVPTRGDRPAVLRLCLDAIGRQVDRVFLVDNSDAGGAVAGLLRVGWHDSDPDNPVVTLFSTQQPPNLSALWNLGLDAAHVAAQNHLYCVAVLNDDAVVPPHWFAELEAKMESAGCVAAGYNGDVHVHRTPGVTPLHLRMPGHAFLLSGQHGLRADEQFQWWCGDNDLDMQARKRGGTLILGPDPVTHIFPDKSTGENPVLMARTGEDMRLFVEKWEFRPWAI